MNVVADPYEETRQQFRPARTRVLFIGESRPANGTFFYLGNSNLATYSCQAFRPAGAPALEMSDFLRQFKKQGCYLVDLCPHPVNQLPRMRRRAERENGEEPLARVIAELQPLSIVVVMTGIARNVMRSVRRAKLQDVPVYVLPFPAMRHQHAYVERLRAALAELRMAGTLNG